MKINILTFVVIILTNLFCQRTFAQTFVCDNTNEYYTQTVEYSFRGECENNAMKSYYDNSPSNAYKKMQYYQEKADKLRRPASVSWGVIGGFGFSMAICGAIFWGVGATESDFMVILGQSLVFVPCALLTIPISLSIAKASYSNKALRLKYSL